MNHSNPVNNLVLNNVFRSEIEILQREIDKLKNLVNELTDKVESNNYHNFNSGPHDVQSHWIFDRLLSVSNLGTNLKYPGSSCEIFFFKTFTLSSNPQQSLWQPQYSDDTLEGYLINIMSIPSIFFILQNKSLLNMFVTYLDLDGNVVTTSYSPYATVAFGSSYISHSNRYQVIFESIPVC